MNPIEQAIRRIDPEYQITDMQRLRISESRDPKAMADILPVQVESNRYGIATGLGVPVEFVTVGDGLSAMNLTTAARGQSVGSSGDYVSKRVDPVRVLEIGKRFAAAQAKPTPKPEPIKPDPLHAIYAAVLDREPDAEGLAFWRKHYEGGMPLSEVIGYIERSDEATG